MEWALCLTRTSRADGMLSVELGHPLLDDYLRFVAARVRTKTLLAVAYDLRVVLRPIETSVPTSRLSATPGCLTKSNCQTTRAFRRSGGSASPSSPPSDVPASSKGHRPSSHRSPR